MKDVNVAAGFVDVHVHMAGSAGIESVIPADVVAVRNAGMRENTDRAVVSCTTRGDTPLVVSSCWALCKAGGYGSRFGVPLQTRGEIKAELCELKEAGADIIKVIASGMVSFANPGKVTPGGFDREELRFIVDEAKALGLGVMAHANAEPAILAAAEAGVRSIEHGFFMTFRALEVMAANRVYWTPTVGALMRAAERHARGPAERQFASDTISRHLGMLLRAYALGVPLAIGTDCMLPDSGYKEAYHSEFDFFLQAGIPRDAVLEIACKGGARLLGIEKSSSQGRCL